MKRHLLALLLGIVAGSALGQGATQPSNARQQFVGRQQMGGGGVPQPTFDANFAMGSIAARGATPTFTRATTASLVDQDGIVRTALSGEARFQGLRRVFNIFTASENLAGGSWANVVGQTATRNNVTSPFPPGGTAATVTATSAGGGIRQQITTNVITGHSYVISFWAKATVNTAATYQIENGVSSYGSAPSASYTVTPTAQRFTFALGTATVASPIINFELKITNNGDTITVGHPVCEDVTGQAVQNPAEYVSVGVLSAPYHGANVDGVRYFPTHNGNVVQQNQITRSNTFSDAGWSKAGLTVTTASGIADPFNGSDTVWLLNEDGSTGNHSTSKLSTSVPANQYATGSIYFKSATSNRRIALQLTLGSSDYIYTVFNLETGTIATHSPSGVAIKANAAITPLSNGWYRLSTSGIVNLNSSAAITLIVYFQTDNFTNNYTGDNSSRVYTYGAQVQPGRRAGTYVATTTAAVNNNIVEELAGDTITVNTNFGLGYLSEGSRTNLMLQSENLNLTWVLSGASVGSSTSAPDGTNNIQSLVESAANVVHYARQSVVKAASSLPYAASVYLKSAGRSSSELWLHDGAGNGFFAFINTNTCAVTSGPTASGVGWSAASLVTAATANSTCRVDFRATSNAAAAIELRVYVHDGLAAHDTAYLGNGASGIGVWGADLEQAAWASSYIPTTVATVTRNADFLTYPTAGWLVQTVGTWVVNSIGTPPATSNNVLIAVNNAGTYAAGNGMLLRHDSDNTVSFGGNGSTASHAAVVALTPYKFVAAYDTTITEQASTIAGGAIVKNSTFDYTGGGNRLQISNLDSAGTQPTFSPIGRVSYYGRRVPDTIMQNLSR